MALYVSVASSTSVVPTVPVLQFSDGDVKRMSYHRFCCNFGTETGWR